MMSTLDAMTAAARVELTMTNRDGRTEVFRVGPLKMAAGGRIQAWINKLPHPRAVEQVSRIAANLPPAVQKELMDEARITDRSWPPQIMFNTPMALDAMIAAEGGMAFLITQVLQQARPDLDEATIRTFVAEVSTDEISKILEVVLNVRPNIEVTARRNDLLVLGADGLGLLVRAVAAVLGVEAVEEKLDIATSSLIEQMALFGQVISLSVSDGRAALPKATNAAKDEIAA